MPIAVLLLLLLALVGCSEGTKSASPQPPSSPSTTTQAAISYASVVELRDAAIKAGYPCPNWKLSAEDDSPAYAKEAGTCSDPDVFSVYDDTDHLDEQLELATVLGEDAVMHPLVGPNWMINLPDASNVELLQAKIGGKPWQPGSKSTTEPGATKSSS